MAEADAMSGEVWFAVLPDGEAGLAAARVLRPRAAKVIAHGSGRPWLLGSWPDGQVRVAKAGAARLAVIGRCPVTADALSARLERMRDITETERAAEGLAGSFHLVTSMDGQVRVRGSASAVRRVFHARVAGVTVAASHASVLASVTGAGVEIPRLALRLLFPVPPYPLDDQCVWQGLAALRPDHCLLIDPAGRARSIRWWSPPDPVLPAEQGVSAVRGAVTTAVESCTAGGGTVSADLSGGMDSTSLCFLAARGAARLVTLRWEGMDPENDDRVWAERAVAELPDIEHVVPGPADTPLWFAGLTGLDAATAEPSVWVRAGARSLATVEQMADRGSRLHICGGGGDELFCAPPAHLHDLIRRRPLAALARIRRQHAHRRWPLWPVLRELTRRDTFGAWLAAAADGLAAEPATSPGTHGPASQPGPHVPSLSWGATPRIPPWATPEAVEAVRGLLREAAGSAPDPLSPQRGQHTALQCVRAAGSGIHQMDEVTSRLGVEYAAPYFDDGVIEAALSVRVHQRNAPARYKPVLAAVMRGIVPESVLQRSTKGNFSADFHAGLRQNRAELLALFDDSLLAQSGLVNVDALRAAVLGLHPGPDVLQPLDATLGCEVWLRSGPDRSKPLSDAFTGETP
ncbi:asparagine synthase-related protein [Streptomyces gobiensis]|uniref:asparagine synthase-related protein n=1 Tax=Streptomyces gobiensis TaxID=2875706 RepID=UPI001E55BE98|nr:asparagine synthase-related protein [Streptomyces gobiensis]UGY92927.1 asparagine synthetase B family protein [Streptomyces gobiensis]